MTAPTPLKNHPINVLLVDDQPIIAESVKKFPALTVEEHQIDLTGAPWFKKQDKKLLVCRFNP